MSDGGFEYGCHNCVGACCLAGNLLQLERPEADFLAQAGTDLQEIAPPEQVDEILAYAGTDEVEVARRSIARELPPGRGAFGLRSNCGHLAVDAETGRGVCTVWADPARPKACAEFPENSIPCHQMRIHVGLPARLPRPSNRHS